jgi:hypothetical protein
MSKESRPNKGELIPSINHSLAKKKSGLVKRGFELISELKKEVTLSFTDYQEGSTGKVLHHYISLKISDRYNVKDKWSYYGDELLEFAETEIVDIFILNLNCITNSGETLGLDGRLEYSYKIVTQIKKANPVSLIIAFSGWPNQAERAKLAGADFYLEMPFKLEDIMQVVEKCLNMLHGFDRISRKRLKGSAGHTTT